MYKLYIYIYIHIYIYAHTHTHTHTKLYIICAHTSYSYMNVENLILKNVAWHTWSSYTHAKSCIQLHVPSTHIFKHTYVRTRQEFHWLWARHACHGHAQLQEVPVTHTHEIRVRLRHAQRRTVCMHASYGPNFWPCRYTHTRTCMWEHRLEVFA